MTPEHEREFREFVASRSQALLHTAYLLTGDRYQAQDLLQNALLATAGRWGAVRNREQPETYVRAALYRHQFNWWRRRSRRPEPGQGRDALQRAYRAGDEDTSGQLTALPPGVRPVGWYDDHTVVGLSPPLDKNLTLMLIEVPSGRVVRSVPLPGMPLLLTVQLGPSNAGPGTGVLSTQRR